MCRTRLANTFRPLHRPLTRPWSAPRASFVERQRRCYRRIDHRQLLHSWNTFRLWLRDPLFYFHIAGIGGLCGLFYCYNLERVPISGRIRFNYVPEHMQEQLGKKLYQDEVAYNINKIFPKSSFEHRKVEKVLYQLLSGAGLTATDWRIHVIDDPDTTNAHVLPGGSVFVYSGLLDLCSSESELATVLAHEIAHNLAGHGAESVSRFLLWLPLFVVSCLASGIDPDLVEVGVDVAFKLPNSRIREREADRAGLLIMAESGFDPNAAVKMWLKMDELEGQRTPAYMSTHPSHHERVGLIQTWLEAARSERLVNQASGEDFHSKYHFQRGICGLVNNHSLHERLPPIPDENDHASPVQTSGLSVIGSLISMRRALHGRAASDSPSL